MFVLDEGFFPQSRNLDWNRRLLRCLTYRIVGAKVGQMGRYLRDGWCCRPSMSKWFLSYRDRCIGLSLSLGRLCDTIYYMSHTTLPHLPMWLVDGKPRIDMPYLELHYCRCGLSSELIYYFCSATELVQDQGLTLCLLLGVTVITKGLLLVLWNVYVCGLSLLSIVSLQAIGGIEVKDLLRAGTFQSLSEPVHRAFRYYRVIVQLLLISSTYNNKSRIQYNNMILIVSSKNLRKMVMINRHFIER